MGIYDELSQLDKPAPPSKKGKSGVEQKAATTSKVTRKRTSATPRPRHPARKGTRAPSRHKARSLPSRDEIQEFSFRLRDDLKVKVQAEVPHGWQKELEEMSRQLDVKKLELYRFILGEFLGKVKRKPSS